jgi:hypothetical protein
MTLKERWLALGESPIYRAIMFGVGCIFLIITPLVGPLPGPGGVFTFAIGMGLVLRNSLWAKKHYARFKRKQPKMGSWADWGLRRQSARRRADREKQSLQEKD